MRKRILLHTMVGHPIGALLGRLSKKLEKLAHAAHWYTLPRRTRSRMKREEVKFQIEAELFWYDLFWIPMCSLANSFSPSLATKLYYLGPHEVAEKFGACGWSGGMSDEVKYQLCECGHIFNNHTNCTQGDWPWPKGAKWVYQCYHCKDTANPCLTFRGTGRLQDKKDRK